MANKNIEIEIKPKWFTKPLAIATGLFMKKPWVPRWALTMELKK